MKLTIIAKIRETRTRFLQPTRSECILYFDDVQDHPDMPKQEKAPFFERERCVFVFLLG